MSIAYKTLGAVALVTLLSSAAFANDAAPTQSADKGAAVTAAAPTTSTEVIKTEVEKTTATSYTLSTRKVGLVGGRPYKPKTVELEGGVRKDVTVNGVKKETEIIVPDTVAPLAETVKDEDYYTNKAKDAAVYAQEHSNVHVHNIGKLNH